MKNKFNIMLELSFCSYVHFAVSFSYFFFNIANQEYWKTCWASMLNFFRNQAIHVCAWYLCFMSGNNMIMLEITFHMTSFCIMTSSY